MAESSILILTSQDTAILETIQEKLKKDVTAFYEALGGLGLGDAAGYKEFENSIEAAQERIKSILEAVHTLLNPLNSAPTVQTRKDLAVEFGVAYLQLADFKTFSKGTVGSTALQPTGLRVEELLQTLALFKSRISKLGTVQTPFKRFQEANPDLAALAGNIRGGAAQFGGHIARSLPLGGLALKGMEAAKASIAAGRQTTASKENAKFAYAGSTSSKSSAKIFDKLQATGNYPEENTAGGSRRGSLGEKAGRAGVGGGSGMGLFEFFDNDKGAKRAKWTKELLEAVQGKKPEDAEKKDGFNLGDMLKGAIGPLFAGIMPMLAGILPVLIPIVLGVLAAGAGAAVGTLINKFVGPKIQKAIGDNAEKGGLDKEKKAGTSPLVIRARELQMKNPNMSIKDSIAAAQQELGGAAKAVDGAPKTTVTKTVNDNMVRTETEKTSGGNATIERSGDIKPTSWDQRTETQKRNSILATTDNASLKTADFMARQKDRKAFEAQGIKLVNGEPVMNELTDEQRTFAGRTNDRSAQESMLRENVAGEARAKLDAGVPVDTVYSEMQKQTADGLADIAKNFKELAEQSKAASSPTAKAKSGSDAYSTNNRAMATMNLGTLDNQ